MQLGIISEVMSDGRICMLPSAFNPIRNLVLANIDGRTTTPLNIEKMAGTYQLKMSVENGAVKMVKDYVGDGERIAYYGALQPEDRLINMVCLCGPMTRNGEACSYGTKALRDKIMFAADYAQCKGHIIYCDTPGGMASCLQDMRMAINYAHDRGQKVYMLIDGVCASGGAFTAAICDKVFFVNPEDEIGSLGMYAAMFVMKDGATNTITSEVYREYYATASSNKNDFYRAAAEGDMSIVAERIETSLANLLETLKHDRPSITEEQMTGKMYPMSEVIGTLVDGQSDIKGVAQMLLADWDERQGAPVERKEPVVAQTKTPQPPLGGEDPEEEDPGDPEPIEDPQPVEGEDGDENDGEPEAQTNNNNMKQYTAIPAAIGEGAMESVDGSLNLQEYQAEALENLLAEGQNREAELQQQVEALQNQMAEAQQHAADQLAEQTTANEQLQSQLSEVQQQVEQLTTDLNASRTALEEANTAHDAAIAELNTAHEAELAQHGETEAQLNNQIANLQQQNADLQTTVEDLNNAQGQQPAAGQAPGNNGEQAKVVTGVATSRTYDPRLSAKENAARWNAAREAERARR